MSHVNVLILDAFFLFLSVACSYMVRATGPRNNQVNFSTFYPLAAGIGYSLGAFFVFILLQFGDTGVYTFAYNSMSYAYENAASVLLWMMGGMCCYVIGNAASTLLFPAPRAKRSHPPSSTPEILMDTKTASIMNMYWSVIFVVSLLISIFRARQGLNIHSEETSSFGGPFASILSIIGITWLFIPSLLYFNFLSSPQEKKGFFSTKTVFFIMFGISLLWAVVLSLSSATKGSMVMPLVYMGAMYYLKFKKFPTKAVVPFLVVVIGSIVVIQTARFNYKNNAGKVSAVDLISASNNDIATSENLIAKYTFYVCQRFNVFTPCMYALPTYERGEGLTNGAYFNSLLFWVPSFVFTEKPESFDGNEFGRKAGILNNKMDIITVVRPTYFGELIITNGGYGLLVGMAGLGFLFGIMSHLHPKPGGQSSIILIYLQPVLWLSFIDIEAPLTNAMGGFGKFLMLLVLAQLLVKVFHSKRAPAASRALPMRVTT